MPLQVGDICLLKDPSLIRISRYPLAKIESTTASRTDGQIRTAKLRIINDPAKESDLAGNSTKKPKYLVRDVRSVALLEISPEREKLNPSYS